MNFKMNCQSHYNKLAYILCFIGMNDVSFDCPGSRGSFDLHSPLPASSVINQLNCSMEQSLNKSWMFYNYTATTTNIASSSQSGTGTYVSNPNKAIVTINARTTEVCNYLAICSFSSISTGMY